MTNADKIRAIVSVVSMKKAEYAISSVLIQTFRFMKGAGKLH